jgi:hypothetical protein
MQMTFLRKFAVHQMGTGVAKQPYLLFSGAELLTRWHVQEVKSLAMFITKKSGLLWGSLLCGLLFLTLLLSGVAQPQPSASASQIVAVSPTTNLRPTATPARQPLVTPVFATPTPRPTVTSALPNASPTVLASPTPETTFAATSDATKIPFMERFSFRRTDTVRQVKPGLIHVKRTDIGPININLLLFDLSAPELEIKVAFRDDGLNGVARTSVLARDNDAIAAVNGDLFSASGLPQGMSMTDGKLVTSPKRRATFGYSRANGPFIGFFTQEYTWNATVTASNSETYKVFVLNNICRTDWLCVYNDMYGVVLPVQGEIRVLLNELNEVINIVRGEAVRIPTGYHVLVGKGQAAQWLLNNAKIGDRLDLNLTTDPDYRQFEQIVSGGPVFLRNGGFVQDCMCYLEDCSESRQKDVWCEEFTTEWKEAHYLTVRMPRNAVGYNIDKSVLIVALVDGYQPGFSIGMTQRELANLFLEFGADSAMELDGGGSATMYLDGKLASRPSDGGGNVERAVPNALVFKWNETTTTLSTNQYGVTTPVTTATPTATPNRR